jgi:hypothetical protein
VKQIPVSAPKKPFILCRLCLFATMPTAAFRFNRGFRGWHGWGIIEFQFFIREIRVIRSGCFGLTTLLRLGTGTPCEGTRPTASFEKTSNGARPSRAQQQGQESRRRTNECVGASGRCCAPGMAARRGGIKKTPLANQRG